jgi:hypothetical protein
MYAMEDELRKKGYDIDGRVTEKVKEETSRLMKANVSSLPSSRPSAPSNKITLTKEQREFCDENGLSYETYARTLQKQKAGEGEVTV